MCPQAIKLKERIEENVCFTPESGHQSGRLRMSAYSHQQT